MSARTPADKEIQFRVEYLRTGCVADAARKAGIPKSTGYNLAKYANADADFVTARRELWTRALPDVERMLVTGCETAWERLQDDTQGPIDGRAQYLRCIVDAYKALAQQRQLDAEKSGGGDERRDVVINVYGPDGLEVEGDEPDGDKSAG